MKTLLVLETIKLKTLCLIKMQGLWENLWLLTKDSKFFSVFNFWKCIKEYVVSLADLLFPNVDTSLKLHLLSWIVFFRNLLIYFIKNCKILHKGHKLFLKRLRDLRQFLENASFCIVDLTGNYLNIPHENSLLSLRKHLHLRVDKQTLTDALVELSEKVLKCNNLHFPLKT